MARTIVDSTIKDRTARGRLKARRKPYWREIEPNLAVGYRKLKGRKGAPAGPGTWSARHYVGGGAYTIEKIDGVADDFSDANGVTVLDFKQAQDKARARHLQRHAAIEIAGPLTVKARSSSTSSTSPVPARHPRSAVPCRRFHRWRSATSNSRS